MITKEMQEKVFCRPGWPSANRGTPFQDTGLSYHKKEIKTREQHRKATATALYILEKFFVFLIK